MNTFTRILLVGLRLAIGWHFLFEGLDKLQSLERGPTVDRPVWTSAGFLRSGQGPLAPLLRRQLDDPNQMVLARITPPASGGLPPLLDAEWNDYLTRFTRHYELTALQARTAERTMEHCKARTARWLETLAERREQFRQKLEQLEDMRTREIPAFGREARRAELAALGAEIDWRRKELLDALGQQTEMMRRQLLDPTWLRAAKAANLVSGSMTPLGILLAIQDGTSLPTAEQERRGPVPESEPDRRVEHLDRGIAWALAAIGACLLAGLFTRTACVAGAAFLVLVYLISPPFPWLPGSPLAEGHYLFIDRNAIEACALLALASTRSGRWLGFDALIGSIKDRWRRPGSA